MWYFNQFDWNFYLPQNQWFDFSRSILWPYGRFRLCLDRNVENARTKPKESSFKLKKNKQFLNHCHNMQIRFFDLHFILWWIDDFSAVIRCQNLRGWKWHTLYHHAICLPVIRQCEMTKCSPWPRPMNHMKTNTSEYACSTLNPW